MALSVRQVAGVIGARITDAAVSNRLSKAALRAPEETFKQMRIVAGSWAGRAQKSAPVRFTRLASGGPVLRTDPFNPGRDRQKLYPSRQTGRRGTGRGNLRKSITPGAIRRGTTIVGFVRTNVPYAAFLEFGTEHIAGGRVLRWRPGKPTVKDWLWRIEPSTRSTMPFIRPHIPVALTELDDRLSRFVDGI